MKIVTIVALYDIFQSDKYRMSLNIDQKMVLINFSIYIFNSCESNFSMYFINVQRTYGENFRLKLVAESILCSKKLSDNYRGSGCMYMPSSFR